MIPIQEIKMFLGTGLKGKDTQNHNICNLYEINNDGCICWEIACGYVSSNYIKPLVRPLSQITEEIEHNGKKIVLIEYLDETYYTLDLHKQAEYLIEDSSWLNSCDFLLIQYLVKYHFDVFGWLEKGLAEELK